MAEPELADGEERYTAVSMIFRNTPDHNFDTLFDLIEDWLPECSDDECTCGMESMGGCSGTREQCWKHLGIHESIAEVKTADLKLILQIVDEKRDQLLTGKEWEAYDRLKKEAYWWETTEEWLANLPEDEEEDE